MRRAATAVLVILAMASASAGTAVAAQPGLCIAGAAPAEAGGGRLQAARERSRARGLRHAQQHMAGPRQPRRPLHVADDTTFVGSFNLSRSGEMNAENVLEIADPALAERMAAFVDELRVRYPAIDA